MGNLCIFHSVLLSLTKVAVKKKSLLKESGVRKGEGEGGEGEKELKTTARVDRMTAAA